MSFFKDIFGQNAGDDKLKKRVWAQSHFTMPETPGAEAILNNGYVYSRVFELQPGDLRKEHGNYLYLGAKRKEMFGKETWDVYYVSYNRDTDTMPREEAVNYGLSSDELVARMAKFEANAKAQGHKPTLGTTENFSTLATRIGMHLSSNGNVFMVDPGAVLTVDSVMTRPIANKFYGGNMLTTAPLSSWEGFYERFVDVLDRPEFADDVEAMRRNEHYYKMVRSGQLNYLSAFKELANNILTAINFSYAKTQIINAMPDRRYISYYNKSAGGPLMAYLYHVSTAVGLLRAGAKVIEKMPDTVDGAINQKKLRILSEIQTQLNDHLQETLGM